MNLINTGMSGQLLQTAQRMKLGYISKQSQQAKIDELQARVDEALKQLDLAYPESWGYCVDEAINILKGNKDEN